ncbi:MAG: DUF4926 domain-containing protein [Alphaproteobacteria bacterium]|nr:MAG: DUF4926 domain-containing protein [Alphaproteobacteria bacterium]
MELFHDVKLSADLPQHGLLRGSTGAIVSVGRSHRRVYTVEFPAPNQRASTMLDLDADAFDQTGEPVVVASWRQAATLSDR